MAADIMIPAEARRGDRPNGPAVSAGARERF